MTRPAAAALAGPAAAPAPANVAVVRDDGTRLSTFDLAGQGLAFTPNGRGGYAVRHRAAAPVDPDVGDALPLRDDATVALPLPVPFPFYGRERDVLYVSANGQATFDAPDASGDGGFQRLFDDPPRIAVLLDRLAPSLRGGVHVAMRDDVVRVTWLDVAERRGADDDGAAGSTAQLVLHLAGDARGTIELSWGAVVNLDALVGLSPGASSLAYPVDLSAIDLDEPRPLPVGEDFRADADDGAVARAFLADRPDDLDFVVVLHGAAHRRRDPRLAHFRPVGNAVAGLGIESFDRSQSYGSGGRLQGVVHMHEPLGASPLDWFRNVLAHETGHRWSLHARVHDGTACRPLLGEDPHWQFFAQSGGSFLGGAWWLAAADGFEAWRRFARFGPLDLYLMGLRTAAEVPPFFAIEHAVGTDGRSCDGTSFDPDRCRHVTGTARTVGVDDVIACSGERLPAPDASQHDFRAGFVLFVPDGAEPDPADLALAETLRRSWGPYWHLATERRSSMASDLAGTCGDGVVQAPDEDCDDGAANDGERPGACRPDCQRARCGDGVRDAGEECDAARHPGCCTADCRLDLHAAECALARLADRGACGDDGVGRRLERKVVRGARRIRRLADAALRRGDLAGDAAGDAPARRRLDRQLLRLRSLAATAGLRHGPGRRTPPACAAQLRELVAALRLPVMGIPPELLPPP